MKKVFFLIAFILSIFQANSQAWQYSETNDPFDGKIILVKSRGSGGTFPYSNPTIIVRYKDKSDDLDIYITDLGYSGCSDNLIRISFDDNPNNVIGYNVTESIGNDAVFFRSSSYIGLINDIKSHSKMSVRFENSCDINTFKYSLFGSSAALDKLLNQTKRYNPKAIQERLELAEKRRVQEEKDREEALRLKNEREEKRKAIEDAKENAVNREFERLKDSIIVNDIPESEIIFLKNSIKKRLELEYFLNDSLGEIQSIYPKIHPEKYMKSLGKHRAYYKFKNGTERIVNNHSFNKGADKKKYEDRLRKFNLDADYLKIKTNNLSSLKISIIGESKNIYNNIIYDTLIAVIPNDNVGKKMFEEFGKVELYFADTENLKTRRYLSGGWFLENDSPILDNINSQLSLVNSFVSKYVNESNRLDLLRLKNLIIEEGVNLKTIKDISFSKKKGRLSKYQFENGLRQLELVLNNGKSKSVNIYINIKTKDKLIFF